MKNQVANVITLMFMNNLGVKDNTDLMRCHILGLELERIEHTIDTIKETSAYKGCHYDIPFNDEFLQELLNKAIELKN